MKHITLLALLIVGCGGGAPDPATPTNNDDPQQPKSNRRTERDPRQATTDNDDDDDATPTPAVTTVQPTGGGASGGGVAMLVLKPSSQIPPSDGGPYRLLRTFTAVNGLISVKYSNEYKAQTVGKSVIQVSRDINDTLDEDLAWIPIPDPISQDLDQFTKVLIGAEVPELPGYMEVGRTRSTCFGVPGYEITAVWAPANNVKYKRWSCTFLRANHGYSFAYDVPVSMAATNEPRLQTIVRSTMFTQ